RDLMMRVPAPVLCTCLLVCGTALGAPPAGAPAMGWIWSSPDALTDAPVETRYFRIEFNLSGRPKKAELTVVADNSFNLYVNGVEGMSGSNWKKPLRQDVRHALKPGRNAIGIVARNAG